ncbi:hypothetical protein WN55_01215 [Dufourea novaeangliae]|uniref:Uncharacterized protein n=1 Tax=Dufourea novaeangliae TaxID=178035 RepID=A0A154NW88_DUFNO|nr:hypothetical protein WN55_01215 [Dufourea novaeangliae]
MLRRFNRPKIHRSSIRCYGFVYCLNKLTIDSEKILEQKKENIGLEERRNGKKVLRKHRDQEFVFPEYKLRLRMGEGVGRDEGSRGLAIQRGSGESRRTFRSVICKLRVLRETLQSLDI